MVLVTFESPKKLSTISFTIYIVIIINSYYYYYFTSSKKQLQDIQVLRCLIGLQLHKSNEKKSASAAIHCVRGKRCTRQIHSIFLCGSYKKYLQKEESIVKSERNNCYCCDTGLCCFLFAPDVLQLGVLLAACIFISNS